ncbi:hypothetical protein DPF79_23245 [Salmonella enterica subsp. enterica serovar Hartford]|nr:hypothetical protein [Salmonella enterica subsp. enterica serovar Hartford]EEI7302070.1 hypothetical protein [Salmonella enterica subsp. enterica serovar Saintpaul]
MARKSIQERRAAALAEVEAAKKRLAQLEAEAAERIGRLAIKAGLVDLDLSDEQLSEEFATIATKFRKGSAVASSAGKTATSEG